MNSEAQAGTTFSLIIPAYNEEKYIGACLDAVMRNAQDAFAEIIVVDNASTDRTAEIASSYPGVRVVREEHKGLTSARQCGYRYSTGNVLTYIDADTRPEPGWAAQIRAAFQKDTKLACISGPYKYYDLPRLAGVAVWVWNWSAKLLHYLLGYLVIGGNFAIRRSVLEQMQGFDETIAFYGEDTDVGRRAHAFGRVDFSMRLVMPTSGRRFKQQGLLQTGNLYFKNFVAIVSSGRPATAEYEDVR